MTHPLPVWFQQTLDHPPTDLQFDTSYGAIHALSWGKRSLPTIICLHGAHANAVWYSALASNLCSQFRFLALDIPGHGQTDWQTQYNLPMLLAVIQAACASVDGPYVLVGHSFGGRLALEHLLTQPRHLAGMCLLDPPGLHVPGVMRLDPAALPRKHTLRPSKQAVVDRFRIIPPQPIHHPYWGTYIAERSVIHTPEGWRWQFDPNFFLRMNSAGFLGPDSVVASAPSTPLVLLYGEHTPVTGDSVRTHYQKLFPNLTCTMITDAYHALMIDQPEALAYHIEKLCQDWLTRH